MVWRSLIITVICMFVAACTSRLTTGSSASKRTTNPTTDVDGSSEQDVAGGDDSSTDGTDASGDGEGDNTNTDGNAADGTTSDDLAGDDSNTGDDTDGSTPPPTPYIVMGGALTTAEDTLTTIDATVVDAPSGATITYSWTRTSNHPAVPANGSTFDLQMTPPQALADYTITYDLVVTVNGDALPTESVVITVAADNDAPVANAGSDQTVNELAVVTLTGTASSDPEGETITYSWTQSSGPSVTLSDNTVVSPTFTAPDGYSNYTIVFSLVVNDGTSNSAADSVTINVNADNDNLVPARHRGYHARACGFDMNRNGIIGEPDDCRVCDGVTTDPDQDGLDEDLWYIDATAGTDSVTCGSPSSPCRSIQYALDAADGPSVGQEDIFCIAGVFNESFTKVLSGKTGGYIRGGFEYPSNPVMIVGWDKNGNGIYPPHDTDDIAVIDGAGMGNHIFNAGSTSYLEMAHLSVRGITASGQQTAGFYYADNYATVARSHLYFHDLDISDINADLSGGYMFKLGYDKADTNHIAIENNHITEFGTHAMLIAAHNYDSNHFLLANNTFEPRGVAGSQYTLLHVESVSNVVIKNNVVDVKFSTWNPDMTTFLNLGNCSQNIMIEQNDLKEISKAMNAFLDATACLVPITQDNVTLRHNYITAQSVSQQTVITSGWRGGGAPDNQTFAYGNLTILGNYIIKLPGSPARDCIASSASNSVGPNPGALKILGNTCIGLGFAVGDNSSMYPQQNVTIQNNIVHGLGATQNNVAIRSGSGSGPSNLVMSNNVWDATSSRWRWLAALHTNLGDWELASAEVNSKVCAPTFLDAAGFNYHLDPTDTCAKDAGVSHPDLTVDQDGDAYPVTGIDIGADQI